MSYIFHNGKFIKGKVKQGIKVDEDCYDEECDPYYESKFVADNGTTIITMEGKKFTRPYARTPKALWGKILSLNQEKVELYSRYLQEKIQNVIQENREITKAYVEFVKKGFYYDFKFKKVVEQRKGE